MQRESFKSRLGFILVSAGCAIGLGNVWKFPYICGSNGGAAFILIYLVFLVILGIPVLTCEFAIGRASKKSVAKSFNVLEPEGSRWHHLKYIGIFGCYLLMMFYTMVGGWMLYYCFKSIRGDFVAAEPEAIGQAFGTMLSSAPTMTFWTIVICVIGFAVCYLGLENGIEKISKVMMISLFVIMLVLAVRSVLMPGAKEGVAFYLVPNFSKMVENGIGNVVFAALSQAFFTLSIGIGAMLIFGSYLDRSCSLAGEAANITLLDTCVALTAGFIIIPVCFAYGITPDAGPSLIFITLPNIFAKMSGGRIWGSLFFLFLSFAALSTIIAVFENLIAFTRESFGYSRKKSVLICAVLVIILSMPCVLGFNLWSGVQPLGEGSTIMDLEDFIVSNNLLPLGSLAYILFCTQKRGWGWKQFIGEVNTGDGIKLPEWIRPFMTYVIPIGIIAIYLKGYYDLFAKQGTTVLGIWMVVACAFLAYIFYCAFSRKAKDEKKSD